MGAQLCFVSQQNLDLFQADPEAYAKQYGGYFAYEVALGNTARRANMAGFVEQANQY